MKLQIARIGTAPKVQPFDAGLNRGHPWFRNLVWIAAPAARHRQELLTGQNGGIVESLGGDRGSFRIPTRMGPGGGSEVDGPGVYWPFSPNLRRITSDLTFVFWCRVDDDSTFGYFWTVNYDGSTFWKISLNIELDDAAHSWNLRWGDSSGNHKVSGPSNLWSVGELACFAITKKGDDVEWFVNGTSRGTASFSSVGDVDWNTEEDVTICTRNTFSPGDGCIAVTPLFMLFDRVLPDGAIVDLYNRPFGLLGEDAGSSFLIEGLAALTISPGGIASAETFGSFSLSAGTVSVSPDGITSEEAFGSFDVERGTVTLQPDGITSGETFGSFTVVRKTITVLPDGIGSGEVFGSFSLSAGTVSVSPDGIASAETFGAFSLSAGVVYLSPSAISSEEAFGAITIVAGTATAIPDGIASGEAFGTFSLTTGGISIYPDGTASGETFGSFTIVPGSVQVSPIGIGSEEAFGSFDVVGLVSVIPSGIASGEAFGSFSLTLGAVTAYPQAIGTAEAFGSFTVVPGAITVELAGIGSAEAFGVFAVIQGLVVLGPAGIPSEEAFGAPGVVVGGVFVYPVGIPSGEAVGFFTVVFPLTIVPAGIGTAETFGVFALITVQFVSPDSIASGEAFGPFTVLAAEQPGQHDIFEEDIEEVFLCGNPDFAQQVEVHYAQEDEQDTIWAIFDREYTRQEVGSDFYVQSREPMLILQTRKLKRPLVKGDWFVCQGRTYSVVTSEPDGTGISEITLKHKV